jgi:hypothetical protein
MTPQQSIDLWLGDVARWNSTPRGQLRESGDTIHKHQKRCADLYAALWPDFTAAELFAVLNHDAGESGIGDVSHTAKCAYPELRAALDLVEAAQVAALGLVLDGNAARIKIVDGMDALLWCASRAPHLLAYHGFPEQFDATMHLAELHRVGERARAILRAGGVM